MKGKANGDMARHNFGLDWAIVWETATTLIPALRAQIEKILLGEFPAE